MALQDIMRATKPGQLPDLGSLVGADQGFWSQPGIDRNRTWGPSGPAYQRTFAGGPGLAQLGASGGVNAMVVPQPAPQSPAEVSAPMQGLLKAVQQRGEQRGRAQALEPNPQRPAPKRPMGVPPQQAEASGPAQTAQSPVQTLTKMARGAY